MITLRGRGTQGKERKGRKRREKEERRKRKKVEGTLLLWGFCRGFPRKTLGVLPFEVIFLVLSFHQASVLCIGMSSV